MPQKIERNTCLAAYPVFPLQDYDEINDEDSFFYPKVISGNWVSLIILGKEELAPLLADELEKLLSGMGIDQLIFLGDTEQGWISKLALERTDFKAFSDAVNYFQSIGADTAFNGAFSVAKSEFRTFLAHFYMLVRCDASLPYFHFIDDKKQYLGTIHYSGQVRIDSFNENAADILMKNLAMTHFKPICN
jgi:hypothetical protein